MSGNQTEPVFKNVTVSGNSSETSTEFDVESDSNIVLQLDGDSESTDLTIKFQTKVRDVVSDPWSLWTTKTSQDLTQGDNDSRTFGFDVVNIEKGRFKVVNNTGDNTTVAGIVSRGV